MPATDQVGMIHEETGNAAFAPAFAFQRHYSQNGWRLVKTSDDREKLLALAAVAALAVSRETSTEKIVDLLTSSALPGEGSPSPTQEAPVVTSTAGSTASAAGKKEK